ncbi:MAG TPA: hypothetical protein VEV62_15495 [Parafilimonas sp.]|jgi:hypothetical protein|nr:hypothetical protein [Parafilimonas sp.]
MGKISFLLLTGAAAFVAYKYSTMSEDEKREMLNKLKEKGKKIYDQFAPEIKDTMKKFS